MNHTLSGRSNSIIKKGNRGSKSFIQLISAKPAPPLLAHLFCILLQMIQIFWNRRKQDQRAEDQFSATFTLNLYYLLLCLCLPFYQIVIINESWFSDLTG